MNTTMSWIRQYVPDLTATPREYADAMTLSGTKVEGYTCLDECLKDIVVGEVLSCTDHPDSDHLHVCSVDVGKEEPLQIVCGAPNVAKGQKVPVVLAGGRVAGSRDGKTEEGGIEIKSGSIRGVESFGMICSIEELGSTREFYPEAPEYGIYVFPEDAEVGADAIELLGLHDSVIEYEVTSNRVDCYSVLGIAREAAATFQKPFHPPEVPVTGNGEDVNSYVSVSIEDPDLCPRYCARVVKNVKIGPSPKWLQLRLAANGIRPINNVVDITNYVMEEYGQPMHAFDHSTVAGHHIIVKRAKDGDVFTTLDGQERQLDRDVLMICDAEKQIGIAGIMGGENSMITDDVDTIVFESACFNGTNIRLSAKRIGLQTDASGKFDKGLDPNTAILAIDRACALMEELGAGEVVSGVVDVHGELPKEAGIPFEPDTMNALLGTDISKEEMLKIFTSVGLTYDESKNEILVPTFRQDLLRVCDLAEEVARFSGYDKIPTTLPTGEATIGKQSFDQRVRTIARQSAETCGYSEAYCYSFESPKVFDKLMLPNDAPERKAIVLSNPLGEDFSIMRSISLNGILNSISLNLNRRNREPRLYEIGNIYLAKELPLTELPDERMIVTYASAGKDDFFDMKGVVECFFRNAGLLSSTSYENKKDRPYLHPGIQAEITYEGSVLGFLGELHPAVAESYGIDGKVVVAAIDLHSVLPFAGFDRRYEGIPKYPSVNRDLSMLVPVTVTNAQIEAILRQRGGKLLESLELFDLYTGESIGPDKKSMAYSLTFRHPEKTLEVADVNSVMNKILNGLEGLGISLRE